jgi:predicted transposase YdaD
MVVLRLVVGSSHEVLHQIFRDEDTLILSAVQRVFGLEVQDPKRADELPGDVTTLPLEGRVDSVLIAVVNGVSCVLAIEAQTEPDEDKETRWPYYLAYLHAKYRRPTALIVVTSKGRTAKWAREPIEIEFPGLGPTMIVKPIVFGPDNVPPVIDLADAQANLGFAVFSGMVHGRSPSVVGILETLAEAFNSVDIETAIKYIEYTEAGLVNSKARKRWEELMAAQTFPYQSEIKTRWKAEAHAEGRAEGRAEGWAEGRAEGQAEGRAEGEAKLILKFLEARGIPVSAQGQKQITSCTDEDQLLIWGTRAATITTEDELFA